MSSGRHAELTEDEMVGWHHRLIGHEFEQTPGDSESQGSMVCCSPLCCRVGHDWTTTNTCSVARSCPALCNLLDCSLPGTSVCGIFQARIMEWGAISSSGRSSRSRGQTHMSCISCIGRWILYNWATWDAHDAIILITDNVISNYC